MEDEIFYSLCDERYYSEDCVLDMLEDEPEIEEVYYGIGIFKTHKDFIDADDIIERAKDRAHEDSEYAEGYLDDITKEQEQELNKLIIDWFNKNVKQPTFFEIKKSNKMSREEFLKKAVGE